MGQAVSSLVHLAAEPPLAATDPFAWLLYVGVVAPFVTCACASIAVGSFAGWVTSRPLDFFGPMPAVATAAATVAVAAAALSEVAVYAVAMGAMVNNLVLADMSPAVVARLARPGRQRPAACVFAGVAAVVAGMLVGCRPSCAAIGTMAVIMCAPRRGNTTGLDIARAALARRPRLARARSCLAGLAWIVFAAGAVGMTCQMSGRAAVAPAGVVAAIELAAMAIASAAVGRGVWAGFESGARVGQRAAAAASVLDDEGVDPGAELGWTVSVNGPAGARSWVPLLDGEARATELWIIGDEL